MSHTKRLLDDLQRDEPASPYGEIDEWPSEQELADDAEVEQIATL